MILPDTSAWIEFLRRTESPVDVRLTRAVEGRAPLATTDVVVMELLAGARDAADRERLLELLAGCEYLRTDAPDDYERAADLSAVCRRSGFTVRKMTDCLVAAVALRHGVAILHADRDYDAIARCSPLVVA